MSNYLTQTSEEILQHAMQQGEDIMSKITSTEYEESMSNLASALVNSKIDEKKKELNNVVDKMIENEDAYNNLHTKLEQVNMMIPKPYKRKGPKIGRNDLCPCGSGKKYKQCCGK